MISWLAWLLSPLLRRQVAVRQIYRALSWCWEECLSSFVLSPREQAEAGLLTSTLCSPSWPQFPSPQSSLHCSFFAELQVSKSSLQGKPVARTVFMSCLAEVGHLQSSPTTQSWQPRLARPWRGKCWLHKLEELHSSPSPL